MPRPTKLTTEVLATLCECVGLGMTYEQSAEVAGIGERTLREWRERKPAVSAALKKAELDGMRRRLQRIERAAEEGAWQADMTWLERKYPEQWGRRDRVQVHHEGEVSVLLASPEGQRMMAALLQALEPYGEAKIAASAALLAIDSAEDGGEDHGAGH
jgi:transposase